MSAEIEARHIEAWRLCLTHAPQPELGQFDWPMVLGKALDEIERLRQLQQSAATPTPEATP